MHDHYHGVQRRAVGKQTADGSLSSVRDPFPEGETVGRAWHEDGLQGAHETGCTIVTQWSSHGEQQLQHTHMETWR